MISYIFICILHPSTGILLMMNDDKRYLHFVWCLDAGRLMQESVALDTSHESSRGTTRLPSPELNADNEEFSDWDSWEDENEVMLIFKCKLDPNLVITLELCSGDSGRTFQL